MSRSRAIEFLMALFDNPDNHWLAYEVAKQLAEELGVAEALLELIKICGNSDAALEAWDEFVRTIPVRRRSA